MLSKYKFVVLFSCILLLIGVLFSVPALAAPLPSNQIVSQGQERHYDTEGDEVLTLPVLGDNSIVSVEKAIANTGIENVFDLTLTVKTTVNIADVMVSADAAVVLVLDISGSMGGINDSGQNYMPALRSSAQNFVDSLAEEAGTSKRYVSLVTFGTDARIVSEWIDITDNANRIALNSYIQNLQAGGATNIQGGLQLARNLLRTEAVPLGKNNTTIQNRSVILFSDGQANKYGASTANANYTASTTATGPLGVGITFDPNAVAAAELMADTVKSQTNFTEGTNTYQKHTAYLFTVAFGSEAPTTWLSSNIATNATYAYAATNASGLNDVFAAIATRIERWAEAWVLTDPMAANIDFLTTINPIEEAAGIRSFQNDTLTWDLKKTTPDSVINDVYTYSYVYRIGLDNTDAAFAPGMAYPTNGVTELTYVVLEDFVIISDILVARLAVPSVRGFAGGTGADALIFTKVGNDTVIMPGCVFTLTNQSNAGHVLSATSAAVTGQVTFEGIPSGFTYTLAETSMPASYDGVYKKSDATYNVTVAYGEITVTDSLGVPVNLSSFKFNNPPQGRRVTGLVAPLALDLFGLDDGFLARHDIVVELRTTFQTPAPASLSTVAVATGYADIGQFTFENVPFGDYVLYIKRPGYLTRAMLVTIDASSPAVVSLAPPGVADRGVFNLLYGDCDNNGRVDNSDLMMISEFMNLTSFSPDYDPARDLNSDRRIDNDDILMVLNMWGKTIFSYAGSDGVDPFS